jgi:hypothetical protein
MRVELRMNVTAVVHLQWLMPVHAQRYRRAAALDRNATFAAPLAKVRKWRIPAEPTSRDYAELAIWTYRKSRALGNWLGIVSGSG